MSLREDVLEWANSLVSSILTTANGGRLYIDDARWNADAPPYWIAIDGRVLPDGPSAPWLDSDADVGWASLLSQIGLPAGLTLQSHDRRILDPTRIRVVLRLTV